QYMSLTEPFETRDHVGMLFMQMLAAFAQFEHSLIAQRTADGRDRVARLPNRWLGGPVPYGFMAIRSADERKTELAIKEDEATVIRLIFDLCNNQNMGAQRIVNYLNERSIQYASPGPLRAKSRKHKILRPWHDVAVADFLRNPLYYGRHAYYAKSKKGRDL